MEDEKTNVEPKTEPLLTQPAEPSFIEEDEKTSLEHNTEPLPSAPAISSNIVEDEEPKAEQPKTFLDSIKAIFENTFALFCESIAAAASWLFGLQITFSKK